MSGKSVEASVPKFSQVFDAAARLPGVRIDRAGFLRAALRGHCTEEQIDRAIAESPVRAGIPDSVIAAAASSSIKFETAKVTGLSALAGVPGGFAVVGTIPADLAQYFGHILRVAQKLAYLYGWPDLLDGEEMSDSTQNMLTLFVGVMFGVQLAQSTVAKVSSMIAGQIAVKLPQRALTKGVIYPIVKQVASHLGVKMTKQVFASGVAKVIPLVGAAVSGGLTLATFLPMSKRLQAHLASLELASQDDVLELVVVQDDATDEPREASDGPETQA